MPSKKQVVAEILFKELNTLSSDDILWVLSHIPEDNVQAGEHSSDIGKPFDHSQKSAFDAIGSDITRKSLWESVLEKEYKSSDTVSESVEKVITKFNLDKNNVAVRELVLMLYQTNKLISEMEGITKSIKMITLTPDNDSDFIKRITVKIREVESRFKELDLEQVEEALNNISELIFEHKDKKEQYIALVMLKDLYERLKK